MLHVLAAATTSLTAYQIQAVLETAGHHMDVVSVYRILDFFAKLGLVFKIGVEPGYFPKRMALSQGVETFIFVDEASRSVYEIACSEALKAGLRESVETAGFRIGRMVLEVVGAGPRTKAKQKI